MDLEALENLRNLNELDLLHVMVRLAQDNYDKAEVVVRQKRWKPSGVSLRDDMQDIKLIAEIIRDKVQIRKGVEWGPKRKFALDKAIEDEVERLKKEKERIQTRKRNRVARNR